MLPNMMKTVEIREFGDADVLQIGSRLLPIPKANEVLIKVEAVGVNGPDLVQRKGHYPPPVGASDLLGLEVSGSVATCGPDVKRWKTGDLICGLTNGGGYAEYVAVEASHCMPIPSGVNIVDAAGIPETYFTVWSNCFFELSHPENGVFLAHGGAGGIGSTAIQIGTAMGLRVFTSCATDDDAQYCLSLGAEKAINYHTADFVEIVRDAGGANLILDTIGGDYVARNIKAATHDARIVQLAFNKGSKVDLNLMPVMLKRLIYTGSTLRSRPEIFKSAIAAQLESEVWPLLASGKIRTNTHIVLPFEKASEAHKLMESALHRGKILLVPG
ncbi:MAG: NADPH2:quinone reductase [bacterium]|jgi:putative PIG3 family NAD(P)H quinone oxidoreductase